ncbi:hypothetical protein BJI67_01345 [Acidihalobacter aeolianus]|uniref:Cytochrome b561 bacterial/Ni-hydrogenase domain-containing protein n=1 Tax=Acidihalobacter aeolianus TaxID=2792603 RepID=A0A1D8K4K9_9GAMM|nr:cytochrome b/b6 domain-containing protein [Acidihalobacter aeolianus]AOV15895.1 hypothetical protein BJI67_01345 [Acidihalobacter aeolianus]
MNTECQRPLMYRLLHWLMAALVFAQLTDGWLFVHDQALLGAKAFAMGVHASLGALTLLCALTLAIWWIIRRGWRVTLQRDAGTWMAPAAVGMHATLLVLIGVEGALGFSGLTLVGSPVQVFGLNLPAFAGPHIGLGLALLAWERNLGLLLGSLVIGHAAAALYHRFRLHDHVLGAMGLSTPLRQHRPQ